jgi:hypothetical protein
MADELDISTLLTVERVENGPGAMVTVWARAQDWDYVTVAGPRAPSVGEVVYRCARGEAPMVGGRVGLTASVESERAS